ncbi:hydantoinase/oxoprolinase family protein [Modestobacter muralis]|uniref:Hydantoinase/oxoprolinase family protein n=1 Tax=Modestobacter muralis TaxID=1608614 RepID=A0A6P0HAD0_9ACTN|nr:hydantoinase/oxoprolinase family protein [Modestobacter muralis]NEK95235.1 hydantoinase/oxoprolinase family protein [Modestobacter muralis]NEN52123.1 hydantoinase/oxoprolinase family protein [Modestobacter muralis]
MAYVIGIDIGGTFTDAFAADEHGKVAGVKTPSTPPDFSQGFLTVLDELAGSLGTTTEDLLADTHYIVHGTTSTLNALVTGDVATVGFLTTRGHADSIAIMNLEGRYAGLGADQVQDMVRTAKPAPLVPPRLVREINERIDHKGSVVVELDEDGTRTAIRELVAAGAQAIAVSLLWSFRNPAHEKRIGELVAEEAPDAYVALSCEVSPRIREYSRSATTIMNTQVGPRLRDYLRPLEAELRSRGFEGSLLVMQGSGGCVDSADAPSRAITTIGSVLTGGVVGCTRLASELGHRNVISTDMGGTTFLAGLVVDGEPVSTTSTVLNQHQLNVPMVDVHTIGAGGGAIAWVDSGGNLHVGPRSAGARPGPACYGEGGTEPTVTDVDLLLGIVNPDNFLGGRKQLSKELAAESVRKHIAEPLGLSVDDACAAVYAIQNAQTADLVRKVVVTSGHDPRDFVLYAFGGAGPMHCASYAADLDVSEVVVPLGPTAAVFSAYGLAASDIVLTAELSAPSNFPVEPEVFNGAFAGLRRELESRLSAQALRFSEVAYRNEVDMRYTMQLAEVATPVPTGELDAADLDAVGASFGQRYEQLYGRGSGFAEAGLQLITYRTQAVGVLPIRPTLGAVEQSSGDAQPTSQRRVFLDARRGWQDADIYDYGVLAEGHELKGPAVVEAPTTTVALPEGCVGRVDRLGNLVIRYTQA